MQQRQRARGSGQEIQHHNLMWMLMGVAAANRSKVLDVMQAAPATAGSAFLLIKAGTNILSLAESSAASPAHNRTIFISWATHNKPSVK